MKKILVSPHNPITGPRHLGHYLGSMKDLIDIQNDYECYVILDDMLASLMYPKERSKIINRTLFVVQDFINAGLDPKKSKIVLTSQLPQLYELIFLIGSVVDFDYCKTLHSSSFCGLLKHYQRRDLNLKFHPSTSEVVYPQIGIPCATLGLQAEYFQGGEEITGYISTMEEIVDGYSSVNKTQFTKPKYVSSAMPFVKGLDGAYMIQGNGLLLSADEKEIQQKVSETKDLTIFGQWYSAFGIKGNSEKLNSLSEKAAKTEMTNFLVDYLKPFRESKLTNGDLIDILESSTKSAKILLNETCESMREDFGLLNL
jgi:tryptophanyl-tRNA synthetase